MNKITILTLLLLSTTLVHLDGAPDRFSQVVNLQGKWKFMIGDDMNRSAANFDDSDWETVNVPSMWENQGFPGYDGFAWYRNEFVLSADFKNASFMVFLGYIDDVDEVFINGVKIGFKGSFPPNYWTAYNSERRYLIPPEIVKFDQKNIIAVRVYDAQIGGGIVSGNVGIYTRQSALMPDINLEGYWKFSKGDNIMWANSGFDDSNWMKIIVPGFWEDQVSNSYDGFGWYRRQFKADQLMVGKQYVLMLGKIDDLDEVYLNGKLVGKTGKILQSKGSIELNNEYNQFRFYYLNANDIIPGQINTIAVRVYDGYGEGGIYTGPVGLIELKKFVTHWKRYGQHP